MTLSAARIARSRHARERIRWKSMMRRCYDPTAWNWRYYGGRGISVCAQWHDFDAYFADVDRLIGPCPDGKSMDRIDNDGNYEPSNIRWATPREQQLNSRNARRRDAVSVTA